VTTPFCFQEEDEGGDVEEHEGWCANSTGGGAGEVAVERGNGRCVIAEIEEEAIKKETHHKSDNGNALYQR
jgi:hypothetical protein